MWHYIHEVLIDTYTTVTIYTANNTAD